MIDDFDDGLTDVEQDAAMDLLRAELLDEEIADYESELAIWEHSMGIGY